MEQIQLRPAVPRDAAALTRLAFAAKASWGYPAEWLELWRPDLTFTQDTIRSNLVVVADHDQVQVGVSGLTIEDSDAELVALWVHPNWMGQGIGRCLFQQAMNTIINQGLQSVRIVSDPNAAPFYFRMGAVQTGWCESTPAGRMLPVFEMNVNQG